MMDARLEVALLRCVAEMQYSTVTTIRVSPILHEAMKNLQINDPDSYDKISAKLICDTSLKAIAFQECNVVTEIR